MTTTSQTRVVAAAVFHEGKLLVARRTRPADLAGHWELPGGKVEKGETLHQAVCRELAEELQIDIAVVNDVPGEFPLNAHHVMSVVLATLDPAGRQAPQVGDTHDAVRWVTRDEALLMHRHDSVAWVVADMPAVAAVANHVGAAWR